jgi:hypothetical protein
VLNEEESREKEKKEEGKEEWEARVPYWLELVKKTATDSRLRELCLGWLYGPSSEGWRISSPEQGSEIAKYFQSNKKSHQDLELIAARRLAKEEYRIQHTEYGDNDLARPQWISWLREDIKAKSWEEVQAHRKHDYEKSGHGRDEDVHHGYYRDIHELTCVNCSRTFYAYYPHTKYCCYRCDNDYYIRVRKKIKHWERNNMTCQHCGKKFAAKRTDAKYCCDSHRVLASLARTSKHHQ